MRERYYFVYIATNKLHKVLYTGVTNNLLTRENQHKEKINKNSFTAKYNVNKVIYYETYNNIHDAISREKEIKGWKREKKLNLIRSQNLGWKDMVKESWE